MSRPTPTHLLRLALNTAVVVAGGVGAGRGAYEVLQQQARIARRVIPKPTGRPFDGDGVYRPGSATPLPWHPGVAHQVHMMIFGDSLAAGLGAETSGELPGVLLARGLAEVSDRDVRLSTKAIVGATSRGLEGQIEATLIAGSVPDVSVILVGGNDVTAQNGIAVSARRLGEAVRMLADAGSEVVVGTCPDLGTIKPVPQPLRYVLHALSVRLGAAQAHQVRRAGGHAVSLADTLAPEFHADPDRLFSPDRFHPNSAGYEMAAGLLLPEVCECLGVGPPEAEDAAGVDEHAAEGAGSGTAGDADTGDEAGSRGAAGTEEPVVTRLIRRLTEFVRIREDANAGSEHPGLHNDHVDPSDPGDAREAADTLRRHSRTARRSTVDDAGR